MRILRVGTVEGREGPAGVDGRRRTSRSSWSARGSFPGSAGLAFIPDTPAFHRQGLVRVHSDLGHDPRPHLVLLPVVELEDRALAQVAQKGSASGRGRCCRSMTLVVWHRVTWSAW